MSREALIVDAGVGNLGNLERAVRHLGAECRITRDAQEIAAARRLLLPGVGAFRPPRETLRGAMEEALRRALDDGAFLLGICVGYQLLFEAGVEHGRTDGLGLLPGVVERLPSGVSLPHIGWNRLDFSPPAPQGAAKLKDPHPLFAGIPDHSYFYFVHSYAPLDVDGSCCLARATHGVSFAAVAGRGRVFGTQFHPEKSGRWGLRLLGNYLEMANSEQPGGAGGPSPPRPPSPSLPSHPPGRGGRQAATAESIRKGGGTSSWS